MQSIQVILLFLVSNILASIHGRTLDDTDVSPMSFKFPLPKGLGEDYYVKQMTEFWTDERINAAVPITPPIAKNFDTSINNRGVNGNLKVETILGTNPTVSITSKIAGYPSTVGKVYFSDGPALYSCSASVVTSDNKNLILTAGHCVYSTSSNDYVRNFIFIPQYNNNSSEPRPFGTWVGETVYVSGSWILRGDYNGDVASVVLFTLNGQHIQDVVGSQGIRFNSPHSGLVHSFGYPSNYNDGQIMTFCNGTKEDANITNYLGDGMPCGMTQGSSGGPWLESFSFSNLSGIQTSVNSFIILSRPNMMFGPYFGSSAQNVYQSSQAATEVITTTVETSSTTSTTSTTKIRSASSKCCTFSTALLVICIFSWFRKLFYVQQ